MQTMALETLRAHFLRKQCLLTKEHEVHTVAERVLGLRGAEGTTPYLSLFWRVEGFQAADFDAAVHQQRHLLRVKGPRGTSFWVTPRQAFKFLAAAPSEPFGILLSRWGMQVGEYQAICEEVRSVLVGGQRLRLPQIKALIPTRLERPVSRKGMRPSTSVNVALEVMQSTGEVTLLKEPGFGRHRSAVYYGDGRDVTRPNLYGLTAQLYPDAVLEGDQVDARRELVRDYVAVYGPVRLEDIVWWTGWGKREVVTHLKALSSDIIPLTVQGLPGEYYAHRDDDLEPVVPSPADIHLLPGGDSAMKGYADFARFLHPHSHDHNVIRFMPAALIGGAGLGNWGYRQRVSGMQVVLELFTEADEPLRTRLAEAATRMGSFISGEPNSRVEVRITTRSGPWHPKQPFPGTDSEDSF